MRKIISLILLTIIFSNCFAYEANDLIWKGQIDIILDKEVFEPGEEIFGKLSITNEEYYPLVDNTIIIQTASGEYSYPSQDATENIFSEKIINDIWALPRETRLVPFSIVAPEKDGEYHLSIYSWSQRSMLVGGDSIMISALVKKFSVNDTQTSNDVQNNIVINRSLTQFGNEKQNGPVGFPASPKQEFSGAIVLENNLNSNQKDLSIEVIICDWSCAISEPVSKKDFFVGEITSLSKKEVLVELNAPEVPSAYEIKMILKQNNEIKSIYSNRVIVQNGTSKIRKIMIEGLEENDFSIDTIIAGSPDHFGYPEFLNFSLEAESFSNGVRLASDSKNFDSIQTGEILGAKFYFGKEIFDHICLRIKKEGKIFDEECFDVPLEELIAAENIRNPKVVDVSWNYNELGKNLEIILTKNNNKIDSRIQLIDFDKSIVNERIDQEGTYKKSFFVENGKYTLVVNDFDAKRQKTFDLYLGVKQEELATGSQIIPFEELPCTGFICEQGFVCDSEPIVSKDGACCMTQCVSSDKTIYNLEQIIPLLFWIAILLFVGAIFVLHTSIKKAGGKRK